MKNLIYLLFTCILLLSACAQKEIKIERKFKEDKVVIHIDAVQSSSLGAWKMDVKAKAYNLEEGTLSFQHENTSLKPEDIMFDWIDETTCIISFPYADKRIRKFRLVATPENYNLMEINE